MPCRRRTSAWGAWMPLLAVFCILMLETVGTFASLYLGGYFRPIVRKPSREGMVAIPCTMRRGAIKLSGICSDRAQFASKRAGLPLP